LDVEGWRMEEKIKFTVPKEKNLRVWILTIDNTIPGINIREEQERLINEIKAGRVLSREGAFYSDEDAHLFVIHIVTDKVVDSPLN
jgi:hypothetical protein